MMLRSTFIFALTLLFSIESAHADPGASVQLNAGAGYFASRYDAEDEVQENSAIIGSQLAFAYELKNAWALGLTLGLGLNSHEVDDDVTYEGDRTTFSKGFGYLEAFTRYHFTDRGGLRPYLKAGLALSISQDSIAHGLFGGTADGTRPNRTTGSAGLSLSVGGGLSYALTEHLYCNLDVTDFFLSAADGLRVNNSVIGSLGLGYSF